MTVQGKTGAYVSGKERSAIGILAEAPVTVSGVKDSADAAGLFLYDRKPHYITIKTCGCLNITYR
jgi:hypothetical protein